MDIISRFLSPRLPVYILKVKSQGQSERLCIPLASLWNFDEAFTHTEELYSLCRRVLYPYDFSFSVMRDEIQS